MLDADVLKDEIENLGRQRMKLAAALQQIDGALGFARGLLAKIEASPPSPPPDRPDVLPLHAG